VCRLEAHRHFPLRRIAESEAAAVFFTEIDSLAAVTLDGAELSQRADRRIGRLTVGDKNRHKGIARPPQYVVGARPETGPRRTSGLFGIGKVRVDRLGMLPSLLSSR